MARRNAKAGQIDVMWGDIPDAPADRDSVMPLAEAQCAKWPTRSFVTVVCKG
jgi:hypothetical protein